jgi:hypothetical protein
MKFGQRHTGPDAHRLPIGLGDLCHSPRAEHEIAARRCAAGERRLRADGKDVPGAGDDARNFIHIRWKHDTVRRAAWNMRGIAEKRVQNVGVAIDRGRSRGVRCARDRAVKRAGQRVKILLPRRIIYTGRPRQESQVQRFFALLRALVLTALDLFRAPPRDFVVLLFALALRFASDCFRPMPLGFEAAKRPVAASSCRCSAPIMRLSDSADRSSSDSSSRDRSRDGCAGITFLAIQSPFSRARCP